MMADTAENSRQHANRLLARYHAVSAPAPAADEHRPEVSLDQETFDNTLEELLAQGTDRRIAEGKAKRAAMIAARKKAAGEG